MVPRALPPSPAEDPTQAQPCTLSSAGRAEWLSPRRGVGVGALGESSRPRAESPRHSLLGSPSEAGSRCAGGVTDGHVPSGRSKSSACSQGFICHWKAATGCTSQDTWPPSHLPCRPALRTPAPSQELRDPAQGHPHGALCSGRRGAHDLAGQDASLHMASDGRKTSTCGTPSSPGLPGSHGCLPPRRLLKWDF